MQASVRPSWCFGQRTQPVSGVWRPSTPCVRWSNPGFDHLSFCPLPHCFCLCPFSHHRLSVKPGLYITFRGIIKKNSYIHDFILNYYSSVSKLGFDSKTLSLVRYRFAPRLSSRTCASSMWGGRPRGRPAVAAVQAGLLGITWLSWLMPHAATASPHTRYCSFLLILIMSIQTNGSTKSHPGHVVL